MIDILLILIVSVLTCAGQLSQKQAASGNSGGRSHRAHVLLWMGFSLLLLGVAMLLWLAVLQRVAVSVAYPMLSLNFILVTLAARWIWREAISLRQTAGIVLIVAGVILMGHGA
ncbi:4-amino-4-deoxy-L-arabinose-phosphoundecaprenol flippase subunit ArnE [Musicola keenii]|uniref:4-amino-4-deoxy-L-arabinose-phosphoundecaprenol flippase subunit ArnE n=1 Tax=Musicola keenii TaxID=2884250 RepID=UPI001784A91A|nr:4-amino-4-deoxy-L-arabinose-phosphoundecaprenol flippase subunit ArnE [Musicola keenii]